MVDVVTKCIKCGNEFMVRYSCLENAEKRHPMYDYICCDCNPRSIGCIFVRPLAKPNHDLNWKSV
jgi:hypothetical protein